MSHNPDPLPSYPAPRALLGYAPIPGDNRGRKGWIDVVNVRMLEEGGLIPPGQIDQ